MICEVMELQVTTPLDPREGNWYIEQVKIELSREELDKIYNVTTHPKDYMKPTTDGVLSWHSVKSSTYDSEEALVNWKNKLHEVSTRRCAHIARVEWPMILTEKHAGVTWGHYARLIMEYKILHVD